MLRSIIDLFFDSTCPCCQQHNGTSSLLCLNCQPPELNKISSTITLQTGVSIKIFSAWHYAGHAATIIRIMKGQKNTSLAKLLADALVESIIQAEFNMSETLLIPAPISNSSLALRGYNQSLILARQISKRLRAPLIDGVFRGVRASTESQKMLGRKQRLENRSYKGTRRIPKKYKSVTLVDDVITTGATMAAMATALADRFSGRIQGVSLARVPELYE
jgi:ComF family protein